LHPPHQDLRKHVPMTQPCPATAAALAAVVLLIIVMVYYATRPGKGRDSFWTQYGGAIPPDEQGRRFDAAEKGVPDMAWAEAYWPPGFCGAVPPPVAGEPARPPFRK
jgi:hypothetical protein